MQSGGQLKTLDLGERGLAHVRDRLTYGRSLSRLAVDELDLEAGTVTTDVPAALSVEAIQNLNWGGLGATDDSRSRQIEAICKHLRSEPRCIALCEDQLAKPTDSCLRECPTKILTAGDEVYHLLDFTDANHYAVETTLSWQASAGSEVVFFSMVDSPLAFRFPSEIDSSRLLEVAKGVTAVLVDVFDGESFAMWKRDSTPPPNKGLQLPPSS